MTHNWRSRLERRNETNMQLIWRGNSVANAVGQRQRLMHKYEHAICATAWQSQQYVKSVAPSEWFIEKNVWAATNVYLQIETLKQS